MKLIADFDNYFYLIQVQYISYCGGFPTIPLIALWVSIINDIFLIPHLFNGDFFLLYTFKLFNGFFPIIIVVRLAIFTFWKNFIV